ncbi:MAG TPA: sugar transferase, partial [Chthoniobacterales bacterium]|nr:sugar transferase [Chthoniobacterales bacterium]
SRWYRGRIPRSAYMKQFEPSGSDGRNHHTGTDSRSKAATNGSNHSAPNGATRLNGLANGKRATTRGDLLDETARNQKEVSRLLMNTIVELVSAERGSNHADEVQQGAATPDSSGERSFHANRGVRIPVWKRALDIAIVALTLVFWLPVMLFTLCWIKFASPGPIFYRQERVGYRGRRFMILKFRTMHVNVETQSHETHFEQLIERDIPMTKLDIAGDPRLIRGGRFFRAAGLDELPQVFNILSGAMSLVGPRPCTPHEFTRYHESHLERFDAPPGLTGYWQVNGKNKTTFSQMIAMDVFYARNMSLSCDLKIILRTPLAVLSQVIESYGKPRFEWKSESMFHTFSDSQRPT